jgi:hypothetical protein
MSYISTPHGIKMETTKNKNVIMTKYHKDSAVRRQIQANMQKEDTSQHEPALPQQSNSSISKPVGVRESSKDRGT